MLFPEAIRAQKPCAISFPSDRLIEWECYQIKRGETPLALFGEYTEAVLRFNRIDQRHIWSGKYLKVPHDLAMAVNFTPMPSFLEHAKPYTKYILINLDEQFLGAYEYGNLVLSFPIASGRGSSTSKGIFKVLGRDKNHRSSLYTIEKTRIPYPMYWGIKFYVSKKGVAFWIHSRDIPGYPASHGCIGLYDEEMQKKYYGAPQQPLLNDSKKLYLWLFPHKENDERPYEYPKDESTIPIEII